MSSWGEDVQEYVRKKSHSAPALTVEKRYSRGQPPPSVIRPFNIVTCATKDPNDALRVREQEDAAAMKHVNRGIRRELCNIYHGYNIITQKPLFSISEEDCRALGGNQEPKGMKTILPKVFHSDNILTHEEVPAMRGRVVDVKVEKKPHVAKNMHRRKTNLLNHRFLNDHDAQKAEEDEKLKKRLTFVAQQNLVFNPVSGTWYDKEHEDQDREKKSHNAERVREEVANHTFSCSGIVARSEGHAFNIVTNNIYNCDMVLKWEQQNLRGIPQRASRRQQWEYQRDVEDAIRDVNVEKVLNRFSPERMNDTTMNKIPVVLGNVTYPLPAAEFSSSKASGMESRPAKDKARPVLDQLRDKMKPREWRCSEVVRNDGPRTTQERLFHSLPSSSLCAVSTFQGRQGLICPTLETISTLKSSLNEESNKSMRRIPATAAPDH